MEGFFERVQKVAGVKANYQSYEILLGGYATAGDLDKVKDVVAYLISIKQKLTARGYSLIIKGFLKNGMAEAALFYVTEMRRQGFYVPAFAVTQLFRVAVEKGCVEKVLDETQNDILFPAECIALILEDCCKNENMDVLKRVEHLAQQTSVPLLYHSYDALVKMYARAGDAKAFDLFEQFQASFHDHRGFLRRHLGQVCFVQEPEIGRQGRWLCASKHADDNCSVQCSHEGLCLQQHVRQGMRHLRHGSRRWSRT
jgi:pentatricopeptide repeat protein